MKLSLAWTLLVLFSTSALAAPPDLPNDSPASQNAKSWSVVGKWQCTHPAWTDTVTILADGTFSRTQGEAAPAGHWTLGGLQDHVILVLAWDHWPTETLSMVTPDEFRGKVAPTSPYGEMEMRRIHPPVARSATPVAQGKLPIIETHAWHQGEPPVRLIRKEEGFCALSLVTGCFQGGGEVVKVYVDDDGYWYLGGQSMQEGVSAECIVVRYPVEPAS